MLKAFAAALLFAAATEATSPIAGPYNSSTAILTNPLMDSSDQRIHVVFPSGQNVKPGMKFPLIAYAHGMGNDAGKDYTELFTGLASFGYIITSHYACLNGCYDEKVSLPGDPSNFGAYYKEQLKAVDWARQEAANGNEVFANLDAAGAAGIAGHSMGGQSTLFSSSYSNATDHNIGSAALHHAFTHEYPGPSVPFFAFTGQLDYIALPRQTYAFFDAEDAHKTKCLSDKQDAGHFEPEDDWQPWPSYNPLVPQYTASFFKIHLEDKKTEFGIDFWELLYGTEEDSICGGANGDMNKCDMRA
jgi:hypothetical protein